MQKYFVGIDLGTGSSKAVAMDALGNTLATAQSYYPTSNPQPGYSEQNPDLIWRAFINCISKITTNLNAPPAAVSFSSAMHSIMPVDEQGNALTDAMLWSDARSGDIAQKIRDSADGEDLYKHTGTAIYAMSPLCKLMWLRENDKEFFNKAFKFISIKEYVWFKLFDVFEVDYSIASAMGMFDVLQLKWYDKALDLAGISSAKLSTPVNTDHKRYVATVDILPGIDTQTAFIIGASDGCCANLGGNAVRPGIGALTIGTSGAVRVGSKAPVYNYEAMTFNYLLNADTFICGGAVNNGGGAVDWLLKDFLKLEHVSDENYKYLFKTIDTVKPGSEGLVFLPYLYGERAPVWDAKSSGAFININFKHQQQHFLRAALEGVCLALNDVLDAVENPEEPIKEIVIGGGFITSATWVQILADITGKKLVLLQGGDSSSVGAIYLAMEALGIDINPVINKEAQDRVEIEPNAEAHAIYSKIFPIYKKLYSDLKSSVHQLHDLNN
ncbi:MULTISPECIES: gluconokinase [unclassified Mucilaginibacter]|uniref:gluconokinase n=1 Tax=unclassified Mucilaginibacter TaxID=2617802 RepID=UPI002AC9761E|nr:MULTISPECIES: gluconokinase [unclassified Mucilaginibacter]MEB0261265.1 gluconokinase [Mucilaginibacter sp. 10I4]MEB0279089.1 gluconokinase [Mucilaginibacter sp. 10B2]MEB0299892.1 gluconokinase [Mucilaginibacter sp. 5C4]WPX22267.1 gluconokinase [Mucilaginibacter sp. 5C4]